MFMKTLQKVKYFMIIFAALAILACSKDDDFGNDNFTTAIVDDNDTSTGTDTSGTNDNGNPDTGTGTAVGNQGEITLYRVSGETITKIQDYAVSGQDLADQQATEKHQEIWELVKKIVPPSYRGTMSEFLIYNGDITGSAGFVVETSADLSKWKMGIAINYAYEGGFNAGGELAYTIIHEFGHILTLNNTQLNASISEAACANYFPGEGCAETNAYINKLYQRFWADIWSDYTAAQNSQSALQQFYIDNQDRFVTNYAATNPGEDIAEVFATFVTRSGGPSGSSIAEQKIQLMYDESELVSLRNYIRSNTSSSASRSRSILPAPGSWKQANTLGKHPTKSHCSH